MKTTNKCLVIGLLLIAVLPLSLAQASHDESASALKKSKNDVDHVASLGISIERFQDLLNDAEAYFKIGDYGKVLEISDEIASLKEQSIVLLNKIDFLDKLLSQASSIGINISYIYSEYNKSVELFESGNYEIAGPKLSNAEDRVNSIFESNYQQYADSLAALNKELLSAGIESVSTDEFLNDINNKSGSFDYSEIVSVHSKFQKLMEAGQRLIGAKGSIIDSEQNGIPSMQMNDLLQESIVHFELGNYDKSVSLSNEISKLIEMGKNAFEKILKAEQSFDGAVAESKISIEQLNEAREKFNLGDFDSAQKLAESSIDAARTSKSSSLLAGVANKDLGLGLKKIFLENWILILSVLAFVLVFGAVAYKILLIRLFKIRIGKLRREQDSIYALIKKLQEDYFRNKKLSKSSYEISIDRHQERLLRIKEIMPDIESRIEKISKRNNFLNLKKLKWNFQPR